MIAGEAVTTISARLRDPSNTAHPRADIRDILNRVQTILNVSEGYVLEATPVTLIPGQAIYRLDNHMPNLAVVTDVGIGQHFLDRVPWRDLWKISGTWMTDVGEPRAWAMIGKTLVAVYPIPSQPVVVDFRGPVITTQLTDDNIPLDLRDEDADIAIDIATSIFLLRQRDLEASAGILSRAMGKLGMQADAIAEEMRYERLR